MRLFAAAVFVLFATAHADAQPKYCAKGTEALLKAKIEDGIDFTIATICKPGDVIAIPGKDPVKQGSDGPERLWVLQRYCDFDKTIFVSPDGLINCVLVGQIRRTQ